MYVLNPRPIRSACRWGVPGSETAGSESSDGWGKRAYVAELEPTCAVLSTNLCMSYEDLRRGSRVCNWATATHRRCGYRTSLMSGDVSRTIEARHLLSRLGRTHARRLHLCRPCVIRDAHAGSDAPRLGTASSYANRESCALHLSRRGRLTRLPSREDDVGAGHGSRSRCTRRLRSLETGRTAVFKPGAQRTFHGRGGEQILHVVRSRASRAHAGPACDDACQRARSDAIKGRKYLRGARTAATSQKRNVSTILAVSGSLAASEYDFRAAYGERACGITEARVSVQREGQRRMQQREAGGGGRALGACGDPAGRRPPARATQRGHGWRGGLRGWQSGRRSTGR
ncbi:hypothetical protein OH76DRAFT_1476211, partial [Lentinus brumalis]